MITFTLIHLALLLVLPFLVSGLILKTKAFVAGRQGPPFLQLFYDLSKLLRKGAVYSNTTTWIFRAGPIVALATALLAGLFAPLHATQGPLGFDGDVVALAYVLALGRFFTMLAAMDTGSSFEGMGASREASFSILAEPALFLALTSICIPAGRASFAVAWGALQGQALLVVHPQLFVTALSLFAVLLAENSRIPVDDPNTHLELTMIHEVMVLDHGGPDFALVLYGSFMKLLVFESLVIHLLLPIDPDGGATGIVFFVFGTALLSVGIGLVESLAARMRLTSVTQFLVGASILSAVGLLIGIVGGQL